MAEEVMEEAIFNHFLVTIDLSYCLVKSVVWLIEAVKFLRAASITTGASTIHLNYPRAADILIAKGQFVSDLTSPQAMLYCYWQIDGELITIRGTTRPY